MRRSIDRLAYMLILAVFLVGCGGRATTTPGLPEPTSPAPTSVEPTLTSTSPAATDEPEEPESAALTSFSVNLDGPFATVDSPSWEPSTYSGLDYELPLDLNQVTNIAVLEGLTGGQEQFLLEHGFVVMHTQEDQFHRIRQQVSDAYGQPYFLSADAAFHALHLTFDELLKALEKEWLQERLLMIVSVTLDELRMYKTDLQGPAIEEEYDQAAAYLSVAGRLFDDTFEIDPEVEQIVQAQVEQVLAQGGKENSVLFPDFEDDYGAYKPVGHYAGDPELESYFRGMSWLGRVNFSLEDETSSRVPLLITLALRRAQLGEGTAAQAWGKVHEVLTFLVGPSDDPGPLEFAALMDEVYGTFPAPGDLADEALWSRFVEHKDDLPRPRINSLFVDFLADTEAAASWRFMGQRFTLDGFILQNLIFDNVKDKPNGDRRWLPTGPDVMAALGSDAALDYLEGAGEGDYPGYLEQMGMLMDIVQAQTADQWRAGSYDAWLYAFLPILTPKEEAYPNFMQTNAWALREMNTCLGNWAELKHDTILYAKMPEGAGGGGPPCTSGPPPSYIEANPEAFYRMAYVAEVIVEGLTDRNVLQDAEPPFCIPEGLSGNLRCTRELGLRFKALGDLAAKELAGEELDIQDHALILRCLGAQECFGIQQEQFAGKGMDPLPIVAAVTGSNIGVLEAATGYVDRIFVIVPIGGRLYAAQGGVYSYYEFVQPREDRLTDEAWREKLESSEAPDLPPWSQEYVFEGGSTANVEGFYIGAAYELVEGAEGVVLREEAGPESPVSVELDGYTLVQIVDGPVELGETRWWLFEDCFSGERGWAPEGEGWFSYFTN